MKQFLLLILVAVISCTTPNPNTNDKGENELKSLEVSSSIKGEKMPFQDIVYVPIYSDIYFDVMHQNNLLSATLSIRNTSFNDTIFVSKIEYYNTDGDLVRKYIDKTIGIPAMGTVNYVVERDDNSGGSGANFIIEMGARSAKVRPLVQAIMIGENGNKGFSFATDGYSLLR